jgi:Flp pilus assembly CpaF family ATPase
MILHNSDTNTDEENVMDMFSGDDETPAPRTTTTNVSQISEVNLDEMFRLPPDFFKAYWPVVDKCVEWIYQQSKNNNTTDMFIKARMAGRSSVAYQQAQSAIKSTTSTFINKYGNPDGLNFEVISDLTVFEVLGLSIIDPIWADPRVEEIWIDGPNQISVSIKGDRYTVPSARFENPEHINKLVETILQETNRKDLTFNTASPYLDARLRDRSRVAAKTVDLVPDGPIVDIRRHPMNYWTISDLVDNGTCNKEMILDLGRWIKAGMSMLFVGTVGSGKTTCLNALSGLFPNNKRIMSVEDVLELELNPNKPFKVPGEEARKGDPRTGEGAFTMRDHVKADLRFFPDILVVGETRDATAYDLVDAANTGVQIFSTLHASSAENTISRLVTLISMSGTIRGQETLGMIASSFDIVVYMERMNDGVRRMAEIAEIAPRVDAVNGQERVPVTPLWKYYTPGENPRLPAGGWLKSNDISDDLAQDKHLITIPHYSWKDCLDLEGFEGKSTKIVH